MGRTAKIALAAVLGGLVLRLAVLSAALPPASGASASLISRADAPPPKPIVPAQCRIAIDADPECAAAWEAKRRHFFGHKDDAK